MAGKTEVNQEKIVVLDFGSQYNQLITRRIREFGVYSELHPHTITAEEIKKYECYRYHFLRWSELVFTMKHAFTLRRSDF